MSRELDFIDFINENADTGLTHQELKELYQKSKQDAKKRAEQTERELRERYQESRQKRLQMKEQAQQQEQQKLKEEIKTSEHPKCEVTKQMLMSKRIAAIISLLLCIVLYLSFLSAFSTKRDTYICYTTKTGECFHSATCSYLNTAYETTVYEASQKYKACKFCNPCVKQYETTITDRNYVIPILISVPISIAVYLLLTYKKKK